MTNAFRVQSLSIEGFKGFTARQEIDLKGRHVFLLGQNGNGKSSVIEAIRWGLFGSTGRRQNEIVANRSYTSVCRVILSIMQEDKQWRLQRTLNRGVSGGSDPRLFDDQGREHPTIRDVIPQLDSADAGEETYIVFASQSPRLSRQPENLEPFERTVFNHLGLTNPRSLLSQIDGFLTEQGLIEKILGEKLTTTRDELDSQIRHVENQRGLISASPPWGNERVPSVSESETKARNLIAEITGNLPEQSLSGVSLDGLIDYTEDALKNGRSQTELQQELQRITAFKNKLKALFDIQSQIKDQQEKIQSVQSQLHSTLDGVSIDELQKSIAEKQVEASVANLKRQILDGTSSLLQLDDAEPVLCPICESEHLRSNFEAILEDMSSHLEGDSTSDLQQLRSRLSQADGLEQNLQLANSEFAELRQGEFTIRESIEATDAGELTPSTNESIEENISRCTTLEASIKAQIDSHENWIKEMQARLSNLKRESSFHSLQRKLQELQDSRNRFGAVQRAYDNLVAFGESVRTIRQTVESCLTEELEKGLPKVSENLSQVFAALTRHPWYDQLKFAEDKLPKLELRVTSSQEAFGLGHPTDVLNGQAESALELVPYFAFSQTDDAQAEIYLVLLDDPTRAFDENHIGILVEGLAEMGRHVQLVVASQETARFRALLPQHFKPGSYVIIEPAGWSYHEGPKLDVQYG